MTEFGEKTRIPRPPRCLVPRPGLLSRLGRLVASHPLVLVSAPAGFGKTSLAAEFLAGDSLPGFRTAWLSLGSEDDDPGRFWSLLGAALDSGRMRIPGSPGQHERREAPRQASPESFLAALGLAPEAGEEALLVIDDFHVLSSPETLGGFLSFIQGMPARLHLLVLSRTDPGLTLPRLRARGLCAELRSEDLRFSPEEAEAFFQGTLGPVLTRAQALAIDRRAEGWPAGLQLAALSLLGCPEPEAFVRSFSGSDRFVLEFLVEEVLAAQSPELRLFLLSSAVFDRFSADLLSCSLPFPGPDCQRLLALAESSNLFLVSLDDQGQWYRYHHLFAEALRARGRAVLGQGQDLPGIYGRAAAWHLGHGGAEEALDLYLKAGMRDAAADVLAGIAFDLLARGERVRLEARLEDLGEEAVLARPRLAETAAWMSVFSGRPQETERLLSKAEAQSSAPVSEAYDRNFRGTLASMRAFVLASQGRMAEAVARADEAWSALDEECRFPRSLVPFIRGTAARTRGDYPRALASMEEFLAMAQDWGEPWTLMMAHNEVLTTARYMGLLGLAQATYGRALELAERRKAGSFASSSRFHGNYAEVLYELNRVDEALDLLMPFLDGGETWLLPTDILVALAPAIRIRLALGETGEAEALLARAQAIESRNAVFPRVRVILRDLRSRLCLARGETDRALQPRLSLPEGLLAARQAMEATDLRALLAAGRVEGLAARAEDLSAAGRAGRGLALAIEADCLAALAYGAAGEGDKALAALRRGLETGLGEGFLRSFLDPGPGLLPFLGLVARDGPSELSAYASRVLAAASGSGAGRNGPPQPGPRVSARELAVLRLLAEGHSNRDMAAKLFVSEATVKTHLHHLAEKLHAGNRVLILAKARELRLLD